MNGMTTTHKTIYYGGMIPSKDFDEYEYQAYLNSASLCELENDIVTKETLDKIGEHLSINMQYRIAANAWNKYLE